MLFLVELQTLRPPKSAMSDRKLGIYGSKQRQTWLDMIGVVSSTATDLHPASATLHAGVTPRLHLDHLKHISGTTKRGSHQTNLCLHVPPSNSLWTNASLRPAGFRGLRLSGDAPVRGRRPLHGATVNQRGQGGGLGSLGRKALRLPSSKKTS